MQLKFENFKLHEGKCFIYPHFLLTGGLRTALIHIKMCNIGKHESAKKRTNIILF